ncbi:hypothetical protein B0T10DRAFT_464187 [Thelonectria olida]|uniref:Uncharacterized protein n=1 Tax=Thelonectria olida TaxID=1576542 RepID=A0A9P8VUY7_9HYPO|nr:hypothetical protein B0T10DRAFT_464187 [Thelonectria olida]
MDQTNDFNPLGITTMPEFLDAWVDRVRYLNAWSTRLINLLVFCGKAAVAGLQWIEDGPCRHLPEIWEFGVEALTCIPLWTRRRRRRRAYTYEELKRQKQLSFYTLSALWFAAILLAIYVAMNDDGAYGFLQSGGGKSAEPAWVRASIYQKDIRNVQRLSQLNAQTMMELADVERHAAYFEQLETNAQHYMSKWQFKSWDNALWPLHRQHRVGVCKKHAKLLEGALDELGPGFLNGDKARVSRLLPDMGPFGDSCIKMAYPERSGVDIDSLLRACRQSKMLFTGITDLSYKLGLAKRNVSNYDCAWKHEVVVEQINGHYEEIKDALSLLSGYKHRVHSEGWGATW